MNVKVSMTSYPGRIKNVGMSLFLLLECQTRKPDEIHLWLAKPEYPLLEKSLPADLQLMIKHPKVHLHWLETNTYCHKRHEIFKYTSDDDCVFLIDDDVQYSPTLIERVMKCAYAKDCIICYNQYSKHEYSGRHILYGPPAKEDGPKANWNRWCGQSMIPSKLYPKEILDDAHQSIRNACSPISDECWFQPWTVWYDIPIFHLHDDWGKDIDPKNGKDRGIVSFSHQKEANGLEKRDNWLFAVLSKYPNILEKYKKLFNYG